MIFAPFYVTLCFGLFWLFQPLLKRFLMEPIFKLLGKVHTPQTGGKGGKRGDARAR